MKILFIKKSQFLIFCYLFLSIIMVYGQNKNEDGYLGKADLYKAKKTLLDYLSESETIKKFGSISDSIWEFAELGYLEYKSSSILIKALEEEGFNIEKGIAGMPTCFIATWGKGKPVIGFLGEYDALPMLSQKPLATGQDPVVTGAPGHGCGHNMMGAAGVAAIIAVKKSMEMNHLGGTIRFFGSPAEESGGSRPFMVKEGVFNDVDAVIDNHAGGHYFTRYGVYDNALICAIFSFKGKTAHSAADPWNGRSALDGVELMNVATNYLHEHLYTTHRIHYVITEGGEAPNVVPDKASAYYYIRDTDDRIESTFKRVVDCAKGAALASGTVLDTIIIVNGMHQQHLNKGIAETLRRNMELIGYPEWTEEEQIYAKSLQKEMGVKETGYPVELEPLKLFYGQSGGGASSDIAEVSMVAPTATLTFPGQVPGSRNHHWSMVTCGYGTAAWKGLNAAAKVMAATAVDLLTKPELLAEIKNDFAEHSKKHPYKSFLPPGCKPRLHLNKELLDKYRDALKQNEH